MIYGPREKKTSGVKTELGDIKRVVTIDEPEKAEGDYVEQQNKRCNYAVDQS